MFVEFQHQHVESCLIKSSKDKTHIQKKECSAHQRCKNKARSFRHGTKQKAKQTGAKQAVESECWNKGVNA